MCTSHISTLISSTKMHPSLHDRINGKRYEQNTEQNKTFNFSLKIFLNKRKLKKYNIYSSFLKLKKKQISLRIYMCSKQLKFKAREKK